MLPAGQDASIFAFSPTGDLLLSNGESIRIADNTGSPKSKILNDSKALIMDFSVCADRYLVLQWAFHGGGNRVTVWRTDLDGSNPKRLTTGTFEGRPICTPDGKTVYFEGPGDSATIFRIPIDGGTPERVASSIATLHAFGIGAGHAISPDGKLLAIDAEVSDSHEVASDEIALVRLDGSSATPRTIPTDPRITASGLQNTLAFTPDGKSVAYIIREHDTDNIFVQPIDGSPGHQITTFTSQYINKFRYSPDGKTLAVYRNEIQSDVVLLREK
jgi:Tol biopolymer transport system component